MKEMEDQVHAEFCNFMVRIWFETIKGVFGRDALAIDFGSEADKDAGICDVRVVKEDGTTKVTTKVVRNGHLKFLEAWMKALKVIEELLKEEIDVAKKMIEELKGRCQ